MNLKKMICGFFVLLMSLAFVLPALAATNIFPDPGLETADSNFGIDATNQKIMATTKWIVWSDEGGLKTDIYNSIFFVDTAVKKEGNQSLKIVNQKSMSHSCFINKIDGLKPGTDYTLVCSIKTQDVISGSGQDGASATILFRDSTGADDPSSIFSNMPATMNTDWTDYYVNFKTPAAFNNAVIQLKLWASKGTVWFDNINIYEGTIKDPATPAETVSSEASSEASSATISSEASSSSSVETAISSDIQISSDVFQDDNINTKDDSGNSALPIILICVGAVVLCAGVCTFIILKKKGIIKFGK